MKGDRAKTSGIKKLFSKLIKKRPKDKDKEDVAAQNAASTTLHGDTPSQDTEAASDLDAYWPVQRRPHPLTTRLPSAGTVQHLVDWFDQNDGVRRENGGDKVVYRATQATLSQEDFSGNSNHEQNRTKHTVSEQSRENILCTSEDRSLKDKVCVQTVSPTSSSSQQLRGSSQNAITPSPQRTSYFTSNDNARGPSRTREPSTAEVRQVKVANYLSQLPVREVSRSSSMPYVGPRNAQPSSELFPDESLTSSTSSLVHETLLVDTATVSDSDDVSDVTTIVPVESYVASNGRQNVDGNAQSQQAVVHYHLSIQNCNGINIHVNSPTADDSSSVLPRTFQVEDGGALKRLSWVEEAPPTSGQSLAVDSERRRYFHSSPGTQACLQEVLSPLGDDQKNEAQPSSSSGQQDRLADEGKHGETTGQQQSARTALLSKTNSEASSDNSASKGHKGSLKLAESCHRGSRNGITLQKSLSSSPPQCLTADDRRDVPVTGTQPADVSRSAATKPTHQYPWHCSNKASPTTHSTQATSQHSHASPAACQRPDSGHAGTQSPCSVAHGGVKSPPLLTATRMLGSEVHRPKPQNLTRPVTGPNTRTDTIDNFTGGSGCRAASDSQPSGQQNHTISPGTDSRNISYLSRPISQRTSLRSSMESITTDILMSECDSCSRDLRRDSGGPECQLQLSYADNAVEALTSDRHRPVALVAPHIREPVPAAVRAPAPATSSALTHVTAPALQQQVEPSHQPHLASDSSAHQASHHGHVSIQVPAASPQPPVSPALSPVNSSVPSEVHYFHQLQQYQLQQQQQIEQELLNLEQQQEVERLAGTHSLATQLPGLTHPPTAGYSYGQGRGTRASGPQESSRGHRRRQQPMTEQGSSSRRPQTDRSSTSAFTTTQVSPSPLYGNQRTPLFTSARTETESSDNLVTASSVGGRFRRTRSAPRIRRSREETNETGARQASQPQSAGVTDPDAAHSDNEDDRLPDRFAHLKSEIIRVPGVLILSTRRGRLIVYLSRDRPNTEGVVQFMMRHGIARYEYDCKVLPSRFRVRTLGHTVPNSLMVQA